MNTFNRMTILAACELVGDDKTHAEMEGLEFQWGISDRCVASSKAGRMAALARIALDGDLEVMTEAGRVPLSRAVIDQALKVNDRQRKEEVWTKFVSGLRFDGFEIIETEEEAPRSRYGSSPRMKTVRTLTRMLPDDVPELDFREAESEVVQLLNRHGFAVAKGHLQMALSAFERGEWSSANGELRKLYESYLDEIADKLGYSGKDDSKLKRDFLGTVQPPFLLEDYNEWNANNQKPQFVQGLMNRLHPHGGHAGLSEEEDATFRLQIVLVTTRLLLRRFDQRPR